MGDTSPEKKFDEMRAKINEMVRILQSLSFTPAGARERALVITNLQQARLWAGEALKEMGYFEDNRVSN